MLAIRLHALGDTVLTLPYLHALRRVMPHAELDFLTRREVADIPRGITLFDRVFEISGGRDARRILMSALALVPRLSRRRYDVVLDLQRNRVSRAVRRLLGAAAWSEFDRHSPRLAGDRVRATIEAAGLGPLRVHPELQLRETGAGLDKLRTAGWDGAADLVVLNPAATFPGRRWPIQSYARFARLWLERVSDATQFMVLGLPSLRREADVLERQLQHRLLNLVGRTSVIEAFALVRHARLVLSEDSGLMHMAWVIGTPTLALFGASRSDWSRPHGNYSDCLAACRGSERDCIIDGRCHAAPTACLEDVSPEAVLQRALELLHRTAERPKLIHARA